MHICSSDQNFFGGGTPRRHIFGHFNFANSRILADFWSKIAIFYCNEGPVPQNEVSTMNNFLEADYPFFGSVRKNFGHPAPRRHIFGDAEISTKIDFWPKIRIFAILSVRCTQKGWVPWIFFWSKILSKSFSFWKKSRKGLGLTIGTQMAHLKFWVILGKILLFSSFWWCQKFLWSKMWVWGGVRPKNFRPAQNISKRFPKNIFMSIGLLEPAMRKEISFFLCPKKWNFSSFETVLLEKRLAWIWDSVITRMHLQPTANLAKSRI